MKKHFNVWKTYILPSERPKYKIIFPIYLIPALQHFIIFFKDFWHANLFCNMLCFPFPLEIQSKSFCSQNSWDCCHVQLCIALHYRKTYTAFSYWSLFNQSHTMLGIAVFLLQDNCHLLANITHAWTFAISSKINGKLYSYHIIK